MSKPATATQPYQPKTGQPCHCRLGQQRDNCPDCEGTGERIDFAAIRRFSSRFQPIAERCDGAGPHSGNEVRVLPLGSGGNAILCQACHWRERSDIRWINMRVYETRPL